MKYQFQIDNRPAGPVRDNWQDAGHDAVSAGYATAKYDPRADMFDFYMDSTQGASIARISCKR